MSRQSAFSSYDGEYKNGRYHGIGTLTEIPSTPSRNKWEFITEYKGSWVNGAKNGFGIEVERSHDGVDKSIYEGEWLHNSKQGKGEYRCISGNWTYSGEWDFNQRSGWGVLKSGILPSMPSRRCEYTYEGDWNYGFKHGNGVYSSHEETYVGEWLRGERHGKGTCTQADGSMYSGGWVNGERHGEAVCTKTDGTSFVGEWLNGKLYRVTKFNGSEDPAPRSVLYTFDSLFNHINSSHDEYRHGKTEPARDLDPVVIAEDVCAKRSNHDSKFQFNIQDLNMDYPNKNYKKTSESLKSTSETSSTGTIPQIKFLAAKFEKSRNDFDAAQAYRNFEVGDTILREYIIEMNWTLWECQKLFDIGRARYNKIKKGQRRMSSGGRLCVYDTCYREAVLKSFNEYILKYIDTAKKDSDTSMICNHEGLSFKPNYLNWYSERAIYSDYCCFVEAFAHAQQHGVICYSPTAFGRKLKERDYAILRSLITTHSLKPPRAPRSDKGNKRRNVVAHDGNNNSYNL